MLFLRNGFQIPIDTFTSYSSSAENAPGWKMKRQILTNTSDKQRRAFDTCSLTLDDKDRKSQIEGQYSEDQYLI
ncbi:hypothetical protein M8J75_012373 [Diaphorina citri]|nr:hypothetical protein M8J75_012373 [Diaphorina citri]